MGLKDTLINTAVSTVRKVRESSTTAFNAAKTTIDIGTLKSELKELYAQIGEKYVKFGQVPNELIEDAKQKEESLKEIENQQIAAKKAKPQSSIEAKNEELQSLGEQPTNMSDCK